MDNGCFYHLRRHQAGKRWCNQLMIAPKPFPQKEALTSSDAPFVHQIFFHMVNHRGALLGVINNQFTRFTYRV